MNSYTFTTYDNTRAQVLANNPQWVTWYGWDNPEPWYEWYFGWPGDAWYMLKKGTMPSFLSDPPNGV